MDKLTPEQLKEKIEDASTLVQIGQRYLHYKNNEHTYIVNELVIIEATNEVGVVYEPEYFPKESKVQFMRPLSSWLEKLTWDGKEVSRFTKFEEGD